MTINQSKPIRGENYIVVNYKANSLVKSIWVLWKAQDDFFSAKRPNANARTLDMQRANSNIEILYKQQKN